MKRHSRATRHAAGFEKQPKPFVCAEEPRGPAANFYKSPNYLYIYNGETGGSGQEQEVEEQQKEMWYNRVLNVRVTGKIWLDETSGRLQPSPCSKQRHFKASSGSPISLPSTPAWIEGITSSLDSLFEPTLLIPAHLTDHQNLCTSFACKTIAPCICNIPKYVWVNKCIIQIMLAKF